MAVKTVSKAGIVERPGKMRSLATEISALRKLRGCPLVVQLHEVYENDRYVHLVLEHMAGGSLMQRLEGIGAFEEYEAARVTRCVLEALAYCHAHGIMHRDVKPENIILT